MRIAAIIPGLPEPADRGTYLRYRAVMNLLRGLGQVDCCALVDRPLADGAQQRFAEGLHRLLAPTVVFQPWRPLWRQVVDPLAPNVRHWFDPAVATQTAAFFAGHTYDMVVLGDLVSLPYARAAGLLRFPCWMDRARVDWEFQRQNDERAGQRGLAVGLRRRLTLRAERWAARVCAGQVVCADSDRAVLTRLHGADINVRVVANGVDPADMPDQGEPPAAPVVMVAGTMDYQPNVEGVRWFVAEAWPRIRAACVAAELHLVGRDPVPVITALHGNNGITVTGAVPAMGPRYRAARVVVAPIRVGGGSRLKVAECWAAGRALVATTMAMDGQPCVPDVDHLRADEPESLAAAVLAALVPERNAQLRAGSRAAALGCHWDARFAPLAAEWRQRYAPGSPSCTRLVGGA